VGGIPPEPDIPESPQVQQAGLYFLLVQYLAMLLKARLSRSPELFLVALMFELEYLYIPQALR
jgi:hypothetical protein